MRELKSLGGLADTRFVFEPVSAETSLPTGGPSDWAEFEQFIIRSKYAKLADSIDATFAGTADITLLDRCLMEDRLVFLQLHRELGHLDQESFSELYAECLGLEARLPKVDLYVYLSAPIDVLAKRTADCQQPDWITSSLDLQLQLYGDWRASLPLDSQLGLDTASQSSPGLAASVTGAINRWQQER